MEFQHVNVKLLLKNGAPVDLEPLIPLFHNWIERQVFDELLLDIADYRHVHEGPGVVLIGHQGNYSVDNVNGRLGVRYNRKSAVEGSNQDRLHQATWSALNACQRLEAEPVFERSVRFGGQEIEFFLNDRLLAPNIDDTRKALEPEFEAFLKKLFRGEEYLVSYASDPHRLFGFSVKTSRPFSTADLLANLAA
jgi:hypothetical protein